MQRAIGVALILMGLFLGPALPSLGRGGWWLLTFGICAMAFAAWVGVRSLAGSVKITSEHVVCVGDFVTRRVPLDEVLAVDVGQDGGRYAHVPVLRLTQDRAVALSPLRYRERWRCERAAEAVADDIARRVQGRT